MEGIDLEPLVSDPVCVSGFDLGFVCLYVCVYVFMYVCIHIYVDTYIHIHIHIHTYIYIYIHIYLYTLATFSGFSVYRLWLTHVYRYIYRV